MTGMTDRQRRLFEAALARSKEEQQKREEVPTQRLRTALGQGLGLGFGDEIEGRAVSLATGRPYDEVLAEVRGKIKAYQEARPGEALAAEVGGALIPTAAALLAAPFTGGTSMAATTPTLTRLAGLGAAQGIGYSFGTGEGGATNRLSRVPGGAIGGALGGALGGVATRALGSLATTLTDTARRTLGRRGGSIVENEIQRLVQQTGRNADEIAQDILDGRLLAENKTIRMAVRAYRAGGGDTSRVIQEGLEPRPAQTRATAMEEIKGALGASGSESQAAVRATSEEATRTAERAAYAPFKTQTVGPDIESELLYALEQVPEAIKEVNKMSRGIVGRSSAESGQGPVNVTFTRPITLDMAERIRRAISNAATAEYKASRGGAGAVFSDVEKRLRDKLDEASSALRSVRASAAVIRANREAYEDGLKSLSGDVNEKMLNFSKYATGEGADEAVAAYRAGVLQALEARSTTGSRQSMIRNMINPETKEGILLRQVFPEDMQDAILKRLDVANEANAAANAVLGGPSTSDTLLEVARQGAGVSVSDITDVLSGSPSAMLRVAANLAGKLGRDLTDAERAKIAQILVSDNPDIVRRAISDESAMAKLVEKLGQITNTLSSGAGRASALGGSMLPADVSGQIGSGILAQ